MSLFLLLGVMPASADESAFDTRDLPNFQELYGLILTNLNGLSEADLNRAAVSGLLSQLRNRVELVTNAPSTLRHTNGLPLDKTAVFERAYAYLRIQDLRLGVARSFARAFDEMRSSNKLSGLVLDLRFSGGDDYAEAAAVCDLFFTSEQPLLKWADSSKRSTAKTNSVNLPLMVLVNQRTAGAAEALAAVLREADIGLIVGSSTAGHAQVFKEFALGNGHKVRIASGSIEVGHGHPLSADGMTPDIRVNVTEEAEQSYLEDPYRVSTPRFGRPAKTNPPAGGAEASAGDLSSHRRMTESILIRQSKEDEDSGSADTPAPAEVQRPSVVQDPALARALDVLKGLALVKTRR